MKTTIATLTTGQPTIARHDYLAEAWAVDVELNPSDDKPETERQWLRILVDYGNEQAQPAIHVTKGDYRLMNVPLSDSERQLGESIGAECVTSGRTPRI